MVTFVDDDWTTPELLNSAAIVKFVAWDPKKKTKKEIERKLQVVVRQVQPGSNSRGTRPAPVEPPRTVTTWKVAESAERAALDAMHDDVVGATRVGAMQTWQKPVPIGMSSNTAVSSAQYCCQRSILLSKNMALSAVPSPVAGNSMPCLPGGDCRFASRRHSRAAFAAPGQ